MKIIYINDALAIWGGLERIVVDKVNELAARYGYELYIVTSNQGNHPIPYPLNPKVVHRDLNIQFHQEYQYHGFQRLQKKMELERLYARRLRDVVDQIKPDIIVCVRSEYIGTIVKVKGHVPLVFESHTSRFAHRFINADWYTKLRAFYNNRNVRLADCIVALTDGDANDWREINRHIFVIPNIVNINATNSYCDYNSKSVIFVGRFCAQKDIDSLLHIWKIVHSRYPDWVLHIYGGYGEKRESQTQYISRLDANVVVHEPTCEILNCYKKSSMLLLTSVYEPFGLVLPEAMSCGLPVVSFDCPYGPADIITDGVDGFLIKNRDVQAFADRVCQLIEDKELRVRMGQAAIKSSQRYRADVIMPKWKELFESLCRKE